MLWISLAIGLTQQMAHRANMGGNYIRSCRSTLVHRAKIIIMILGALNKTYLGNGQLSSFWDYMFSRKTKV